MRSNYKNLSIREAVRFYRNLLSRNQIEIGGGAYERLKELELRLKSKMGWANRK